MKMKMSMKKTAMLMILGMVALTAVPALARPNTAAGGIAGTSELRYTDMAVTPAGQVSFTLQNASDREALFNGRLLFRNDDGVLAESALMTGIPVNANGSTRVTVDLERGEWLDWKHATEVEWSGVRVYGGGRQQITAPAVYGAMLD